MLAPKISPFLQEGLEGLEAPSLPGRPPRPISGAGPALVCPQIMSTDLDGLLG
jgi:hypothetical protein